MPKTIHKSLAKNLPETIEAVLFDLDGTLIDTAPTFSLLLNQLLEKHQRHTIDETIIRNQVSHGAGALITLGFKVKVDSAEYHSYRKEFLALYLENISNGTVLFPEIDRVLIALEKKNVPWGIVTNKPTQYTFPLIESLGLNKRCSVVVCPDDVTHTKPNSEPMYLASSRLNVKPQNCVYVGDHLRDIIAGNAAQMFTISALYGYIGNDDCPENWQANHEIHSPCELLELLTLN